MFAVVGTLVTYETIILISVELNEAKRWVEEITDKISSEEPPPGEGFILDCEAPMRYGLPCECWLFPCIQLNIPISISLIHPHWFFDGPSKVVSYNMSFDLELDFAQMMYQAQNPNLRQGKFWAWRNWKLDKIGSALCSDPSSHSQNRITFLPSPTSPRNYGKNTTRRATFVDTSRSESRWF